MVGWVGPRALLIICPQNLNAVQQETRAAEFKEPPNASISMCILSPDEAFQQNTEQRMTSAPNIVNEIK